MFLKPAPFYFVLMLLEAKGAPLETFTLYDGAFEVGKNKTFTFFNDDSCHELTGMDDIGTSMETDVQCIELYEHPFCRGKSAIIKKGCTDLSCSNPHSFGTEFNDIASSYRACETLQAYLHQPTGNKKIAISQLKFIGLIGTGNSANVRLAHFYSDQNDPSSFMDVAVKTVKVNVSFHTIQKEIEIMEECDHENILKFIGWLQEGIHTHIVTEFMHGGSLLSFLRNERNSPNIGQLISYIMQILDGMIYLGKLNILHRDLAARNCLLNSTHEILKISDFGLSRKTDNNQEYLLQNDSELPFQWLPIESFDARQSFSVKGDVWAFGIVIWEIFERGRIPYKGMNVYAVTEFLKAGKRLPQPFYCSKDIYCIMLSCWDFEPKKRPEFDTLKIHLNSIINRVQQPNILPDPGYKNYYETPVKICKD